MSDIDDNLKELHEHRQAIESEWKLAQEDPAKAREVTRSGIARLGPTAVETIEQIMVNGSSENTRLKAAQTVLQYLDPKGGVDAEGELQKLVESLKSKTQ